MIQLAIKIQRFLQLLIQSKISCIRILFLSKCSIKFPKSKQYNDCIILGNGPSLHTSIQENPDFLLQKDLFAVNMFANSEYFEQLKPQYYVILAPELWTDSPSERMAHEQQKLFENIAKATWNMFLYAPTFAKKSMFWKAYFAKNSNITIVWFNATPIEGFRSWNFYLYNKNLGMPRPHNIVTPSLMIAIKQAYSNIYLLGADHSWLQEIWVSEQNEVFLTQKHFYDEKTAQAKYMYTPQDEPRKLHEILHKFMCAFSSYFEIRRYAESKGITIWNATPNSYIDAFERCNLKK